MLPKAPKADTTPKTEDKPEEETTAPTEATTEPVTEAVQYQNGDENDKVTAIQQQLIKARLLCNGCNRLLR